MSAAPNPLGGQAQQAPETWDSYATSLPAGLPDDAFNHFRDQWFYGHVAPSLADKGINIESGRQQFAQMASRPESAYPRTQLMGSTAMQTAAAPIASVMSHIQKIGQPAQGADWEETAGGAAAREATPDFGEVGQELTGEQQQAHDEAVKQGVHTTPYEMAGSAVGLTPYFAPGMTGAAEIGAALKASRLAAKGINALAGGIIQGAYDAAVKIDDRPIEAGLRGAALGTAFVGGFEALGELGPLARFLLTKHPEIEPKEAQAIENVAFKKADEEQLSTAADGIIKDQGVDQSIGEWREQQGKSASQNGVPKTGAVVDGRSRLNVNFQGADGQSYKLVGTPDELASTNMLDHLTSGGSVNSVSGNENAINRFWLNLEELNPDNSKLDIPNYQIELPNDEIRKALTRKSTDIHELINQRNNYYHATNLEGMRGILADGTISPQISDIDDFTTEEAYDQLLQQKGLNHVDLSYDEIEQYTKEAQQAKSGVSVSRSPRFLSKSDKPITFVLDQTKMPPTRPFAEEGYGKTVNEFSEAPYENDINAPPPEVVNQRNPHFEYEQRTYNEPIPLSAVKGIIVDKEAVGQAAGDIYGASEDEIAAHMADIQELAAKHSIPLKIMESGDQLHSYRAGLATQEPGMRWAVRADDIPPLDKLEHGLVAPDLEQPDVNHLPADNEAKVRGSADPPLNANGILKAAKDGRDFARKGGVDQVVTGTRQRAVATGDHILSSNPIATLDEPQRALDSWYGGALEGHPEGVARDVKSDMVRNAPDVPLPGRSAFSGQAGESFNEFKGRVLPEIYYHLKQAEQDAENGVGGRKVIVTHYSPIKLVQSWLNHYDGDPTGLEIDTEDFLKDHPSDSNASVHSLKQDEQGKWQIRKVDMDNNQPLDAPLYLVRHGETDWNPPSINYKETPLAHRNYGDIPLLGEGTRGAEIGMPGEKPSIFLSKDAPRDTLFHENLHGHITTLGLRRDVNEILGGRFADQVFQGAFDQESKEIYNQAPQVIPEEVYAYTAAAIRTGDHSLLDDFAEADTDKQHVLNWATNKSKKIADIVAEKPDSLHKRVFQRRLDAVVNRATDMLEDIQKNYNHTGAQLAFEDNTYKLVQGNDILNFGTREGMLNYLESYHVEPLNTPELVDTSKLYDGITRTDSGNVNLNQPPVTTPPPPTKQMRLSRERGGKGFLLSSYFFRPTEGWLDSVARSYNKPELYDAWQAVDDAQMKYAQASKPIEDELHEIFSGVAAERRKDFMRYFIASEDQKGDVASEFAFTPEEIKKVEQFGLLDDSGELKDYLANKASGLRNNPRSQMRLFDQETLNQMVEDGDIDPHDTDLARVAHQYFRGKLTDELVKPAVDDFRAISKDPEFGRTMKSFLKRKADYSMGRPDITQELVSGFAESVINLYNSGVEKANKFLPRPMQLEQIEEDPRNAIDKLLTLNYAANLGLRPAILVRNIAELFTTTLPVAGKYTWRGLTKVFPDAVGDSDAGKALIDEAREAGALINRRQLNEVYAGGGQADLGESKLEKLSKYALQYLQTSHNATRLVAYHGFKEKILDALADHLNNPEQFIRESGLWFTSQNMQRVATREFASLDDAASQEAFARRWASKLVDTTQWNYRRGAMPGAYQYQLGRLFGQYGTWPANYIEYARRMVSNGHMGESVKALSRLALTHGTILSAGAGMGIDTSHWVFTGPATYGGGPLFNTMVTAPKLWDFSTQEGEDARHELMMSVVPEEFESIYTALYGNDKHKFMRALGFTPAK